MLNELLKDVSNEDMIVAVIIAIVAKTSRGSEQICPKKMSGPQRDSNPSKYFSGKFAIALIAITTATIISSFKFLFPKFTSSSFHERCVIYKICTCIKYKVL